MSKYYLTNGHASGNVFEVTLDEAIKVAEESSSMCTACWLNQLGKGELGRTYHEGPMQWKFRMYES